jgi:pyruvate dehydrogenase E1 component
MPQGVEEGIRKGLYLLRQSPLPDSKKRVQLMGCGAILLEVLAAAELLEKDFEVAADVWSATSFTELRRDGLKAERHNRLHPNDQPRSSYVSQCLEPHPGPVVAASDYMKAFADQIRAFIPRRYITLGTDGFGRSDTREALRRFFEVDRYFIAIAALQALADEGIIARTEIDKAIKGYKIDPEKADPSCI